MAVAKLAGVGGTLAGVVNPSPGSYYPTSGVAAAGQFAIPNQQTLQAVRTTTAPAGVLGGQFGGGPMAQLTGANNAVGVRQQMPQTITQAYNSSTIPRDIQKFNTNLGNLYQGATNKISDILNSPVSAGRQLGLLPDRYEANNSSTWMQKAAAMGQGTQREQGTGRAGRVSPSGGVNPNNPYEGQYTKYADQYKPSNGVTDVNSRIVAVNGKKYFLPNAQAIPSMTNSDYANMFSDVYGANDNSGYGNTGSYGNGYTGYSGNSNGYSSAYDPQSAWYGNPTASVLNWRVATG